MTELLITRQLSRQFPPREVVQPLDLSLARGDILGLLGPNGAGKSTILRMISGDLAPSRGSIHVCGFDLVRQPRAAKRHIGYLPERPPLHPDQRVDEFLYDCARLRGLSRSAAIGARARSRQQCDLNEVGQRLIRKLSKGYQQRVGLAQAILHDPEVVILDEPTDGLDPAQIRQVRTLIGQLARDKAVLLSSHNLGEIQAACNRVVILQQGRCVYQGGLTPSERTTYRLVLEQKPESSLIAELPSLTSVETMEPGVYRLTLANGKRPSEVLTELVARNWGVSEFAPETHNLEQIFLQATTGDTA
ncbi:MAG: ABC transporter ATP-binding protein [Candidatus Thiodiazotropha sp.]